MFFIIMYLYHTGTAIHSLQHLLLTKEASNKALIQTLEGAGGRGSIGPPSTFDTIHQVYVKFGTYNKLPLFFQLSVVTWCSIDFDGTRVNDVTSGRHLGFLRFQILFKVE